MSRTGLLLTIDVSKESYMQPASLADMGVGPGGIELGDVLCQLV